MAVLKTTSPVVFPFAPMEIPRKTVPSARAKTALTLTQRPPLFPGGLSLFSLYRLCQRQMHKAGGVLVERPPALRGLNPKLDGSDSGEILRSGGLPCPCELAPQMQFCGPRRCRTEIHNLLYFLEKIGHSVTLWRPANQPQGRRQRTAGENGTVGGHVRQPQLLPFTQEAHFMLSHHVPAPGHGETDPASAGPRLRPGEAHGPLQRLAAAGGGSFPQRQRRTRGGV